MVRIVMLFLQILESSKSQHNLRLGLTFNLQLYILLKGLLDAVNISFHSKDINIAKPSHFCKFDVSK
jgi:hypothetical protein